MYEYFFIKKYVIIYVIKLVKITLIKIIDCDDGPKYFIRIDEQMDSLDFPNILRQPLVHKLL